MNPVYLLTDTPASRSLAKKLCKQARPNAIILLTAAEAHEFRQAQFLSITPMEKLYFDDNLLETGE